MVTWLSVCKLDVDFGISMAAMASVGTRNNYGLNSENARLLMLVPSPRTVLPWDIHLRQNSVALVKQFLKHSYSDKHLMFSDSVFIQHSFC